ncbi:MAG: FG-GAP-like repeat-containing protein, partial [Actinobacteria bacterium]|nr:FG-GAP-like repeat-containing protein [Actinomycetota bacterium]
MTLIAVQPAPFAPAVEPDAMIEIEFSAPVEADSVGVDTVWVSGSAGGRYPAIVETASPVATSARIFSTRDWQPGEVISVSILEDVVPAEDGIPFTGYTWSFRVGTAAAAAERVDGDAWMAPGVVRDFRLADLDGDGLLDLAYHVEGGSTVEARRRLADGSFSFPRRINVGQLVTSLEVADLDGDGNTDLIVGSPDRAYTYLSGYNGFSLSFSSGEDYVTRSRVHSITAADVDHRGGLDLVLGTATGIQVFLDDDPSDPVHSIGGTRLANTPIRCVDLDLDGRVDLVYGTLGFNLIAYHLAGLTPGEFGAAVSLIIPEGAADVVADDFTGDGRPDLLALLSLPDAGESPIAFLPQFGDLEFGGTSLDVTPVATQSDERMLLADIEGRGSLGILWVDRVSHEIGRLPEHPAVTPPWSAKQVYEAGPASGPLQAADVDGDGRLDLAFASESEIRFLISSPTPPPPPPPEIELSLSSDRIEVRRGDDSASTTIRLTHSVAIQGATIITGYDPLVVSTPSVDVTGAAFGTVEFTTWELIADPPA